MQKLPEVSDRKRGNACTRKRDRPDKRRNLTLFKPCYATMCPEGLQGAVHSRQVHQLKQGTDVGCGLPNTI